jgi:hypothetical protein
MTEHAFTRNATGRGNLYVAVKHEKQTTGSTTKPSDMPIDCGSRWQNHLEYWFRPAAKRMTEVSRSSRLSNDCQFEALLGRHGTLGSLEVNRRFAHAGI